MNDESHRNGEEGLASGPAGDKPMSFFEHLEELRRRLFRAALGLIVAFAICYVFVEQLRNVLIMPFDDAWRAAGLEGRPQLQNLAALDAFLTDIRIAIFGALFLAAPVWFYQLWMFVAPGLYHQEKRLVIPFVSTSAAMFVGGAVFCYFTVLPIATQFFLEYATHGNEGSAVQLVQQYTYRGYTAYTTKLLFGFGLMFELPLAVFFLAKAGVVTHETLLRYWKSSVVVICIASAFLTPPDPITMILMAVPMTALFFASVGVAYWVNKPQRQAAQPTSSDPEVAPHEDRS
jgi:sec-independent protein translocase protein TatC